MSEAAKQALKILISGEVDPRFRSAFTLADQALARLGKEIYDLKKQQATLQKFEMSTAGIDKTTEAIKKAKEEAETLRQKISQKMEMNANSVMKATAALTKAEERAEKLRKEITQKTELGATKGVEKATVALTKAEARAEKLRKEITQKTELGATKGLEKLQAGLDSTETHLSKLGLKLDGQRSKWEGYQSELKKAGVDMKDLSATSKELGANLEKATKKHLRLENSMIVKDHLGGRLSGAASGIMSMGYKASYGAKEILDETSKYQITEKKLWQYGLSDKAIKDAEAYVAKNKVAGVSENEQMKIFTETQGVFRESGEISPEKQLEAAKMVTPLLAKMDFASHTLNGEPMSEDEKKDMMRFIEQAGGLKSSERFNDLANSGFKAIQSSGGNVDWSQMRQFFSKAGTSAYGLSGKALFAELEPIIGEMKGGAAGDGLLTSFQRITGVNKGIDRVTAKHLVESGLWDANQITFNKKTGEVDKITGSHMLSAENTKMLEEDPVQFYKKVMLPAYKKMNLSQEDILIENNKIFGRQGGKLFNLIDKQLGVIDRSVESFDKSHGINETYDVMKSTFKGKGEMLSSKWDDMLKKVGQSTKIIDGVDKAMDMLGEGIDKIPGLLEDFIKGSDKLIEWGKDAVKWIIHPIDSIKEAFGGMVDWVKSEFTELWTWFKDGIKDFFADSPILKMLGFGVNKSKPGEPESNKDKILGWMVNHNPLSATFGTGYDLGNKYLNYLSGTDKGNNSGRAVNMGLPKEARALLDTIAGTESSGYNVMYGKNHLFNDYKDHPRVSFKTKDGGTTSAAGKYQFEPRTWDGISRQYGLKDFTPQNQDAGAWYLAVDTYRQKTKRDLLSDLKSGDADRIAVIGTALHDQWTSLPFGAESKTSVSKFNKAFAMNLAGSRAMGGPVGAGKMYEVNEGGMPELLRIFGKQYLMMGGDDGEVSPLHKAVAPLAFAGGLGLASLSMPLAAAAQAPVVHHHNERFEINIVQQPGENTEALVRRLERMIKEIQKPPRAALYDHWE